SIKLIVGKLADAIYEGRGGTLEGEDDYEDYDGSEYDDDYDESEYAQGSSDESSDE
ncbi:30S ribosomal protein S2, partial [Nodularia spumigena CS-591/04]|nr:30S ribosomal protein S2 [Nodularia spumigena CS-591/04]